MTSDAEGPAVLVTGTRGPKSGSKPLSTTQLPRRSLEECIDAARPIHEVYAGDSASWDEIASTLGIGAKSTATKYLIWGAQAYEIIRRESDKFFLTETGRKLLAPTYPEEKAEAAVKAVMIPAILSKFYSDYDGKLLPDDPFFENVLESKYAIPRDRVGEAKELILTNARFANILSEHGNGKKTIRLSPPAAREQKIVSKNLTLDGGALKGMDTEPLSVTGPSQEVASLPEAGDDNVCFYITPIGDEASSERKHADMLLKHLVEPAFFAFGIKVIRADLIGRAGLISQQIFEYIVSAKFCVADLSFGNPNAFYELGVRHMTKLPTIQIIRKGDKIPFDVAQGRTIVVDISDIYTLMDRMASARKELTDHIQNYLTPQDNRAEDNPVSIYLPGLQVKLPK